LLHGEAIAIGMVLEAFLSYKLCGLNENDLIAIKTTFSEIYEKCEFRDENIKSILNLLKHDKKNTHGRVNFVLLEAIGKCCLDVEVKQDLIYDAFKFYEKV
jgi:3-dehydroquinate synthase